MVSCPLWTKKQYAYVGEEVTGPIFTTDITIVLNILSFLLTVPTLFEM